MNKTFVFGILLISLFPCLSVAYIPPTATNPIEYPSPGDVMFRDLNAGAWGIGFNTGHNGVFYRYNPGTGDREIIEAVGVGDTSAVVSWWKFLEFMDPDTSYWGAYCQQRSTDLQARRDLRFYERNALGVDYGLFFGGYKDYPFHLRCDGLVEYCYEKTFNEFSPHNSPDNIGIVPGDYYSPWMGILAKWICPAHSDTHYMTPASQMEWLNDESQAWDGHDVSGPRHGEPSYNTMPVAEDLSPGNGHKAYDTDLVYYQVSYVDSELDEPSSWAMIYINGFDYVLTHYSGLPYYGTYRYPTSGYAPISPGRYSYYYRFISNTPPQRSNWVRLPSVGSYYFDVYRHITVTAPAGGEILYAGSSYDIEWVTSQHGVSVKIEYSTNGGSSWSLIPGAGVVPDEGSYTWDPIPNTPTALGRIRITSNQWNDNSAISGNFIIGLTYYDAVDVDHIVVDDDRGDGDGVPEGGEDLQLKVYLRNKGSQSITEVQGTISTSNPDITINDNDVPYSTIDPGEVTWGNDDFDFESDPSFSGNVDFDLTVSFYKGSEAYYDTATVPVTIYPGGSGPSFVVTSVTFYDTSSVPSNNNNNNGILESSEDNVNFDVEVTNIGSGVATEISAFIQQFWLAGQPIIDNWHERYPDLPPGHSSNAYEPFEANRIPYHFAGRCTLQMKLEYGDEPDSQVVEFYWDIGAVPYLRVDPERWDFGTVPPGDSVRKSIKLWNRGSGDLIVDSIKTDSSDTHIEDVAFPWTVAPGDTDSFAVTIETGDLNGYIVRNILLFSNSHDTSLTPVVISGTVTPPISAEYLLVWSSEEISRACCIGEGDTDGDGAPELIIGTYAATVGGVDSLSRIHIYERVSDDNYQWVWSSPVNAIGGGMMRGDGMAVGDIDSDGKDEIAVGTWIFTSDPKVYIFKSDGDNSCFLWHSGLNSGLVADDDIICLTIADSDGDGAYEVIYGIGNTSTGYGGRIHVYENSGGSSFSQIWTSPLLTSESGIPDVAVCDADGDGKKEIVATKGSKLSDDSTGLYIFEATGDNSFQQVFYKALEFIKFSPWSDYGYEIATYDLDGDGASEIAVGSTYDERKIHMFEAIGDNAYQETWESPALGDEVADLVAGNTDLNGMGELVVCAYYEMPHLRIFEAFANNSYVEVWNDTAYVIDAISGCFTDANSIPGQEIAIAGEDEKVWVFGKLIRPNLTVASNNIQFRDPSPEEGVVDTISALIRNVGTAEASDVVVRIFDGDPDSGGTQIGIDTQIDTLGISDSVEVETEWIPTLADTYFIHVVVDPDSTIAELDESDNIGVAEIYVADDDVDPPQILNITIDEHPGDGDGWLEDNEELEISWTLQDTSGIDTTICRVDSVELPVSGSYSAIGGPFGRGEHRLIITAIDSDNSPEQSADTTFFLVYPHAPSVESVFPEHGDSLAPVEVELTATFDIDMDGSSINESTFVLEDSSGASVSGSVDYTGSTRTARFIPGSLLSSGMMYTASLLSDTTGLASTAKSPVFRVRQFLLGHQLNIVPAGGIRDERGNGLDSNYVWSFRTELDTTGPDVPVLMQPANNTYLDDTAVSFRWSSVTALTQDGLLSVRPAKSMLGHITALPVRYVLQVDSTDSFAVPVVVDTTESNSDTVGLAEGRYYWRVKAFDLGGNESSFSDPFFFGVDTTPPVIDSTTVLEDTVNIWGPFQIQSRVTDDSPLSNPVMFYRTSADTEWVTNTMLPDSGDWYVGSIPEQAPQDTLRIDYYLTVEDFAGNSSRDPSSGSYSFRIQTVGVEERQTVVAPDKFVLFSPVPNPSMRSVVVGYGLPEKTSVTLMLYDLSGRLVNTIWCGTKEKGYHETGLKCKGLARGIYFIRLEAGHFRAVRKLIILG